MVEDQRRPARITSLLLVAVVLLYVCMSIAGIGWGLPTSKYDEFLFKGRQPWPGQKIHDLAGDAQRQGASRGADVDVNPLDKSSNEPILLTDSDARIAEMYRRYRLFTNQPDEMITMMSLSSMRPGKFDFDPKLYQYGGLFIYPVGAILKACGIVGLIDVRSDPVFYLDNPDEFGKFYIVSRAYAALWGLVGLVVVFWIGRRLLDEWAGLLAALLFAMMPVVVCMSHEGKPHLPGATLMLMAVWFAMRHVDMLGSSIADSTKRKYRDLNWWLMCACCGASFGMVLSSLPIFILMPLVALMEWRSPATPRQGDGQESNSHPGPTLAWAIRRVIFGCVVASAVYFISNPYILINAIADREVIASNFGNSLAMYEISRLYEGLVRVTELTIEGATPAIVLLGVFATILALAHRRRTAICLIVPAAVFFAQFVMIGAGKPPEYGRFGVFTNTALAIAASCLCVGLIRHRLKIPGIAFAAIAVGVAGYCSLAYLNNFVADAGEYNTRLDAARWISDTGQRTSDHPSDRPVLCLFAEPAPYCCPPLDFENTTIVYFPNIEQSQHAELRDGFIISLSISEKVHESVEDYLGYAQYWANGTNDSTEPTPTPISWANKPISITGDRD